MKNQIIIGLMGLLLILLVLIGETIKVVIIEPKIKEYVNHIESERVNGIKRSNTNIK